MSLIAKARRKQVPVDRGLVSKELGDILWQVAAVADDFGLSLGNIGQENIDKLADREARGVINGSGDTR
jgi:NTP pyrophosphatase (non-canonical NTP hydrolase)